MVLFYDLQTSPLFEGLRHREAIYLKEVVRVLCRIIKG